MVEPNEELEGQFSATETDEIEQDTTPGGRRLEVVGTEDDDDISSPVPEKSTGGLSLDMLPPDLRQIAEENPQQAATVIQNALNLARNKLEEQEQQRRASMAEQQQSAQAQAAQWFQDTYKQEFERAMENAGLTQYSSQQDIQKAQQAAHMTALDAATTMKADMLIEAKLQQRERAQLERDAFLKDPSNQDLLPSYRSLERLIEREGHDGKNVVPQIRKILDELDLPEFARMKGFDLVPRSRTSAASISDIPSIPGLNPLGNMKFREVIQRFSNPMTNHGTGSRTARSPKRDAERLDKGLNSMMGPRKYTGSWLD